MTIIFTIWGIISKQLTGIDFYRLISISPIIISSILITIWVFTNPNETAQQTSDNLTVVIYWFLYNILYIIFPFALGESISLIIYRLFGIRE